MPIDDTGSGSELYTEDYGTPVDLLPAELTGATQYHLIPAPPGWTLSSGQHNVLSVWFTDPSDTTNTEAPPANFATLHGNWVRGAETLEVEVTQPTSPQQRTYAELIMQDGSPKKVPLGLGFANGPTFVIDTGAALIRGTYDDGATIDTWTEAQQAARIDALQATAEGFLPQMTVFDAPAAQCAFTKLDLNTGSIGFVPVINLSHEEPDSGTFSGSGPATVVLLHTNGSTEAGTMTLSWSGTWTANKCTDQFELDGVITGTSARGLGFSVKASLQLETMEAPQDTALFFLEGYPGVALDVELIGGTCYACRGVRVTGEFTLPAGLVF